VRAAEVQQISLRAALLENSRVAAVLSVDELDDLLDPRTHLGANQEFIDTALRVHGTLVTDGGSG